MEREEEPLPAGRADEGRPPEPAERLFLALALPEWVRGELAALAEPLRGFDWTRPGQLHLTVRFLGDVPSGRIGDLEERLAAVRVEPFLLPIEGVGAFPPRGPPRVLWAGVGAGHPHLYQLRQRADDAVLGAGVSLDVRFFQPHVTLARCAAASAASVAAWLRGHREFSTAPFRIAEFDLYSSRLTHEGAIHTLRRRYPLGAAGS